MAEKFVINGFQWECKTVRRNRLVSEVEELLGVSVEIISPTTHFADYDFPLISDDVAAVTFSFTSKVDLTETIDARTCLVHRRKNAGYEISAYQYEEGDYILLSDPLGTGPVATDGELGCWSLVNLAAAAQLIVVPEPFTTFVVVHLVDLERLPAYEEVVVDSQLTEILAERFPAVRAVSAEMNECDQFPECRGQEGNRCLPNSFRCVYE